MKPTRPMVIIFVILLFALTAAGAASSGSAQSGRVSPADLSNPAAPQAPEAAPVGTAFIYQGQLKNSGGPVNGPCDLAFRLYDELSVGGLVGNPITATVPITGGMFSLALDFGNVFNGQGRWLDLQVRCPSGGGGFTPLAPRQALTPVPYALALPGLYTRQNITSTNLIGGYSGNFMLSSVVGAVIAGGGAAGFRNEVGGNYGVVSGGRNNHAIDYATVGGGDENFASGYYTTVGGGTKNQAGGLAPYFGYVGDAATIGGGNHNQALGNYATVSGGSDNQASREYATVGGGRLNKAEGIYTTVGGGYGNDASSDYATVSGGFSNDAMNVGASIGGGADNLASGVYATVPGGTLNTATMTYTLAAGYRAQANHKGAFVWADSSEADFTSTANDQFLVRASGGVGLGTNAPSAQLEVSSNGGDAQPQAQINQSNPADYGRLRFTINGDYNSRWDMVANVATFTFHSGYFKEDVLKLTPRGRVDYLMMGNGAHLTTGGVWTNSSDRNAKTGIQVVDSRQVLDKVLSLPLSTWSYKVESPAVRHLGPMAQDFYAAFALGGDDKSISTIDPAGVSLAAIQGLYQIIQEKDQRITRIEQEKDRQIVELKQQVAELKAASKTSAAAGSNFNPFNLISLVALGGVIWLALKRRKEGRS